MKTLRNVAAVMALCMLATTTAAPAKEHHRVTRTPQYLSVPSWVDARPRLPIHYYNDAPSYDDPSKNGCCG